MFSGGCQPPPPPPLPSCPLSEFLLSLCFAPFLFLKKNVHTRHTHTHTERERERERKRESPLDNTAAGPRVLDIIILLYLIFASKYPPTHTHTYTDHWAQPCWHMHTSSGTFFQCLPRCWEPPSLMTWIRSLSTGVTEREEREREREREITHTHTHTLCICEVAQHS